MILWALRTTLVWGLVAYLCLLGWQNRARLFASAAPSTAARAQVPMPEAASNTLLIPPDQRGQFLVDGEANGAPVHFIVDTGASYVTLTPAAARAAGIDPDGLEYSGRIGTANGEVGAAPVTLRELRLGQLTMEDVPAIVVRTPLAISLLGMSFLRRLDGYGIREGRLALEW